MKRALLFSFLIILSLIISTNESAAEDSFSLRLKSVNPDDSIVFINKNSGKEKFINKGNQIKIWLNKNDSIITGNLLGLENDSLLMHNNESIIKVSTSEIKAIQQVTKSTKRTIGITLMAIGLSVVGFACMLIIAGFSSGFLSLLVIPSLLLTISGGAAAFIGKLLVGRKFKLDKNWKIKKR